jgi:hypothetical protein
LDAQTNGTQYNGSKEGKELNPKNMEVGCVDRHTDISNMFPKRNRTESYKCRV